MNETQGGARDGAGRKRIGDKPRVKTSVSIDAGNYDELEDGKRSEAVNAGLDIVIPVLKGNEDEARQNLENFINERK